ncbi:unnamed protein product [Adineta ricciae]|nr:unnamed protein product [Adineta ricciae]
MFTLNVCLAIIVCALYWMTYYIMLEFNPLKLFSVNTCGFLSYTQVLCTFQVSLAFTVVSIHRLCLIVYPTKLFFKTKQWATICVLSQWCVGVAFSLPILIDQSSCATAEWKRIYTLILVVIVPSLSHVIINSIIVKYVRASSLRVRPETGATQISMINPTNQNQARAQHQTKISRRDVHLLQHMIFMFCIFVGGWMPIYVMTVVMAYTYVDLIVMRILSISAELCLLCDIVDLFVYNRERHHLNKRQKHFFVLCKYSGKIYAVFKMQYALNNA